MVCFYPVIALWDYIQATGDWQILDETWADAEYSINSVNGFFDDDLHLLQVERSTSNDAFPEKETGGYALSIQVYYSAALRAAANLARIRNQWEKAAAWDTRAQAVVKAVKSCIGMKRRILYVRAERKHSLRNGRMGNIWYRVFIMG